MDQVVEVPSFSVCGRLTPIPEPVYDESACYMPEKLIALGGNAAVYAGRYAMQLVDGSWQESQGVLKYRYFNNPVLRRSYDTPLDDAYAGGDTTVQDRVDEQALRHTLREVSAVSDLPFHQYLPELWDFAISLRQQCVVRAMPQYTGGTLRQQLLARQMDCRSAIRYTCQIAEALSVVHEAGIIQGDVKPANILLTESGDATLSDFDNAVRIVPRTPTELKERLEPAGTPDYVAPEQQKKGGARIESDIYALGATAYEMLTGSVLFSGSPQETLDAHCSQAPQPFAKRMGGIVPAEAQAVEPFIMKALAKEPDDRFPTALGFMEAVASAFSVQIEKTARAEPFLVSGVTAGMRGDALGAHHYFSLAISEDPTSVTNQYLDAQALRAAGMHREAAEASKAAATLTPRTADELVMQAEALAIENNPSRAIELMKRAVGAGCSNRQQVLGRIAELKQQRSETIGSMVAATIASLFRCIFGRPVQGRQSDTHWTMDDFEGEPTMPRLAVLAR